MYLPLSKVSRNLYQAIEFALRDQPGQEDEV